MSHPKDREDRWVWGEGDLEWSQCVSCKHKTGLTCKAFPEGIPKEMLRNQFDHRNPHPDDNGIRFESY